ncbi:Tolloid-like protein 2 [Bulinus truncatus]|nr:Tolloid-like protein 2 [Bulinus truncatus]
MAIRWNNLLLLLTHILLFQQHVQSQYIECGGDLTDQAGVISSPNFPQNYPDSAFCNWHITVAKDQFIDVRFTRLDLDRYYDQYCTDYVAFYDGPTEQHPRIENTNYCGYSNEEYNLGILIRSTGNQMLVVFKSDSMGSRAGFSASYRALQCDPFTYGRDSCDRNCTCNKTNTDYCHNLYGSCKCNSNWTGSNCTGLVEHCQDPNTCSDPYGICVNVPGGYECRCKNGLTKNSTGQCEDPKKCTQKNCSHFCGVTSTSPLRETCYCPKGMTLNSTDSTKCVG